MLKAPGTKKVATEHGGYIATGHKNVTIGGKQAVTLGDSNRCQKHPVCHPLVFGSKTVTIGGLPAARGEDRCSCQARMATRGTEKVLIGGESAPYAKETTQNCYGLGTGKDGRLSPGELTGTVDKTVHEFFTKDSLLKRTIADLGPPMPDPDAAAKPGHHKIMIFALPDLPPDANLDEDIDWDYHVYREGSDGQYYLKSGQYPITRVDSRCQPITDPRTAARRQLMGTLKLEVDIETQKQGEVMVFNSKKTYTEYVGTWEVPSDPALVGKQ